MIKPGEKFRHGIIAPASRCSSAGSDLKSVDFVSKAGEVIHVT